MNYQNRTNRVTFGFSLEQELKDLLKGKATPGTVEYSFGTYRATAKWLTESKTAKRLIKKAVSITWWGGMKEIVAYVDNGFRKDEFLVEAKKILDSEEHHKLDEIYLESWKKIS